MSSAPSEAEIREFIARHFRSLGSVEVLLLLCRDPSRIWTANEVSRELRTNPSQASFQLMELGDAGLLTIVENSDRGYKCSLGPDQLPLAHKLQEMYDSRKTTLIDLIYSKPIDAIRNFADAFKFKKE